MNFVLIPGFMTDRALWRDMEESIRSLGEIIYGDLSYGQSLQEMALSKLLYYQIGLFWLDFL